MTEGLEPLMSLGFMGSALIVVAALVVLAVISVLVIISVDVIQMREFKRRK